MRLIQQNKDKPEVLEVAWMWLPTFIGQNTALLTELDAALAEEFSPPVLMTEENLNEMHRFVINHICDKLKIPGLWNYLSSVADVGDDVPDIQLNLFRELRELTRSVPMDKLRSIEVRGKVTELTDVRKSSLALDVETKDGSVDIWRVKGRTVKDNEEAE
jgi:hypothetical protein